MAEAIGALASILQIASTLISSTRELRHNFKKAKAAPKELTSLRRETVVFATLIRQFHGLAEKAPKPEKPEELEERKILLVHIHQQCTIVQDGFKELVSKFGQTYDVGDTKIMTAWARVLWVIRRPDMEELKLLMNETKITLTLLATLFLWEEAKRSGQSEEEIRALETQLREATRAKQQAQRELKEYKEKNPPSIDNRSQQKLDELLVSAKAIERHVVRVLNAEARQREEVRREEKRRLSREPVVLDARERGGRPPTPPSDDPEGYGIGPSKPKPFGPGPSGDVGGGGIFDHSPPRDTPVDVPQEKLVEEARPRRHSRTSLEMQRHSPVPPPPPPPLTSPPTPSARRRPRRKVYDWRIRDNGKTISEEKGEWPADATSDSASAAASKLDDVPEEPKTTRRHDDDDDPSEQQQQQQQGRSLRLARDERALHSQTRARQRRSQQKIPNLEKLRPLSPLQEDTGKRRPTLEESQGSRGSITAAAEDKRRSHHSKEEERGGEYEDAEEEAERPTAVQILEAIEERSRDHWPGSS